MAKKKKGVSVPPALPLGGDHGPQTAAQAAGTAIVALTDAEGRNPNNVGQRRRINVLERMHKKHNLSLRQYQAGMEVQEAWCQCEALSSGGPISERVQSSPKPDRFTVRQVEAHSRLKRAMGGVPSAMQRFDMPVWAAINATMLKQWEPPHGVEEVVVFGDNDKKFGGQSAAFTLAHRLAVKGFKTSVTIPQDVGKDWADYTGSAA